MANEYRVPRDYTFGQLSGNALVSDTTLNSLQFAGLPSNLSTGYYLPVTLYDDSVPAYEVVWMTAHATSATSATVVRGKEGTSARAWGGGTRWVCAPTQRDGLLVTSRSTLPTDAHTGLRAVLNDEGVTLQRTYTGLWVPDAGVAQMGEVGPKRSGSQPPTTGVMVMRGGGYSGTTDASGLLTVNHRVGFPNATVCTVASIISTGSPAVVTVQSETAASVTLQFFLISSGAVAASIAVSGQYMSIGY